MGIDTDSELQFILRSVNQLTFTLTKYPDGWEEITLSLKRSGVYDGLFHEFSFDVGFFNNGGGKEFIDFEYETFGVDAQAFIEIKYRTPNGAFETLFDGKLNFSKYSRESNLEQITKVNIEANDITQKVLNRSNVKIDLKSLTTLDGSAMVAKTFNNYSIDMFSQPLDLVSTLEEPAIITHDDVFSLTNGLTRTIFFQDPFPLTVGELPSTTSNNDITEVVNGGFANSTVLGHFHTSFGGESIEGITFPLTYTVTWRFKGTCRDQDATGQTRGGSSSKMQIRYGDDRLTAPFVDLGTIRAGAWNTASTDFLVGTFDISGSTTISMNAGDQIWLTAFWSNYLITTGPGTFNITGQWNFDIAEITIETQVDFKETTAKATAIFEAYSQIAESITDQTTGAFESNYYGRLNSEPVSYAVNGCGAFKSVTNGFAVREILDKSVNTSLDELFFATKAVDNLGLGVQKFNGVDKIVVEDIEFFYDKSDIIFKASSLRNIDMSLALERVYNEAEFGYAKWEPKAVNGINEFNSVRQFELDVTSQKNKLSQISTYIASGFLIEEVRRNSVKPTEDTEFDDNMFFISVSRSVDGGDIPDQLSIAEDDENVTATANISNPDKRYNYFISPMRSRLRWNNLLAPSIFRVAGAKVNFRAGTGNIDAEIEYDDIDCIGDYTGANLPENASLPWDDPNIRLNAPLFIPETYSFEDDVSYTQYKFMRDNLYKMVEFSEQGVRKLGWIETLEFNLKNKTGSFTLIRAFVTV